jgi:AraC family transcriptional regulator
VSLQSQSVPVTMGSPQYRSLELDGFEVTEAWFPAAEVLPRHTHDRACVAIMLDGWFDLRLSGKAYHCSPTSVFTEPAGESHANYMGPCGAHVVVVQPDPARAELLHPFGGLLERVVHDHHAGMMDWAARLVRELDRPDDLASLSAEGIVLEMLVSLSRMNLGKKGQPPRWLLRAQEMLHARFSEALQVQQVACEVGVHPAHLARCFRIHFKLSMGNYLRKLRLDWAARELVKSDAPLAAVAVAAGFADQSHFTRFFKRHLGQTPNAYRRAMRH